MKTQHSFSYYYVQLQIGDADPEIIYHTINDDKEDYYKFYDKKKAEALLNTCTSLSEGKESIRFRIVKCTETYTSSEWT